MQTRHGFTPPRNVSLGAADTSDFLDWLSKQTDDIKQQYYATQAANPSSYLAAPLSVVNSLPTWAKLAGAGLLAFLVLVPPRR